MSTDFAKPICVITGEPCHARCSRYLGRHRGQIARTQIRRAVQEDSSLPFLGTTPRRTPSRRKRKPHQQRRDGTNFQSAASSPVRGGSRPGLKGPSSPPQPGRVFSRDGVQP